MRKTLVQKLCEVMAVVGYTQKTGWNEAQKYHYVTEADIAEKIRPELAKRNILIFPSMVKHERTKLERIKYEKPSTSYATDVLMRWTIVDGDSGEEKVCEIPGCSESPGDKGVYVAITGSEKYLLMKLFLLPTGDDPEDDSNEPKGSKEAAQAVGKAKVAALKEKMAQRAAQPEPEANAEPAVLFSVLIWKDTDNTANDVYEISGHSDVMQAHAELLLAHGKKVTTGKGEARKAVVHMNPERLSDFVFAFEERGGKVKALKPNA